MSDFEFINKAKYFAIAAHRAVNQKRKYTGEPYETHPIAVVEILEEYTDDPYTLAAGYLHDVLEDTNTTRSDIHRNFGPSVLRIVVGLTDKFTPEAYPFLNRATRKTCEAVRLHLIEDHASEIHTIKCADLIDNTKTIVSHDRDFAITYLKEKETILRLLRWADEKILFRAFDTLKIAKQQLGVL